MMRQPADALPGSFLSTQSAPFSYRAYLSLHPACLAPRWDVTPVNVDALTKRFESRNGILLRAPSLYTLVVLYRPPVSCEGRPYARRPGDHRKPHPPIFDSAAGYG